MSSLHPKRSDGRTEIGMPFKRETAEDIQIASEDHGGGHRSIVP